jgi:hypothetical protein
MTKADHVVAHLMDALDLILREALKDEASRHYIIGVVKGAMKRCNLERERDSDGYLVVRS